MQQVQLTIPVELYKILEPFIQEWQRKQGKIVPMQNIIMESHWSKVGKT